VIRRALAIAAVLALPLGGAAAQGIPINPPAPPNTPPIFPDSTNRRRYPGDTTRADSLQVKKELVKWNEPDSVMNALMNRAGYVTTRYQGNTAVFNTQAHALRLSGASAVQRDQTLLVSDTIEYNDSSRIVHARTAVNDTTVLRDPGAQTSDLVTLGSLEYDIGNHKGIAERLTTSSAQAGQTWFVGGQRGAVAGDTTGHGHNTSYALDGSVTSCDLPDPHYHFESKELKMVTRRLLVARPAVLYIQDIPVLWLPFIFQDMRTGRRSGIIPPRFGLSDIVRTGASYQREVDNVGYYFAINDYTDATVSLDWRSGNNAQNGNIGWTRWNGEFEYRWLDRFLAGRIGLSYSTYSDGQKSTNVSWSHQQQFSQGSSLNASINYSSNTTAIRQQAFNVVQALAAIASAVNFQQALGPANLSIGGTRTQYTGRKEIDQNFPNLSVSSKPISVGSWFLWSPQFSLNNTENLNMDAAPFVLQADTSAAGFDSAQVKASQRNTTASFQTPIRIFGFTWNNAFQLSDKENNFPQAFDVRDFNTGVLLTRRMYAKSYLTSLDWQTSISLPSLMQSTLKLSPFIGIVNADPTSGFWVRSQLSGGAFVSQSKTLQYGISGSPTIFGFFPGFGPFTRIRHSISPRITFTYAPASNVSDEFLQALNKTRATYLGGLAQENMTVQLDQVIEAKLKSKNDTNPDAGQKIKLLALSLDPISYDFERAKVTHSSGFNTSSFGYRVTSDLLPGFDLAVQYSLFQGDLQSDTAQFKPFRTGITASFTIGKNNNPITALSKIFGGSDSTNSNASTQALNQQPQIAGPGGGVRQPLGIPTGQGWTASFQFSSSRSRPIPGARVIDPRATCQVLINDPINYQRCLSTPQPADTLQQTIAGGAPFVTPPLTTLRANASFSLTPKWALQWSTGYDFELHEFSDQDVGLQRDMHDWRAIFHFSRAPNGNFAFSFYIALKAEPDLKFDYNRSTYRPEAGSLP
jgi:lipopolysaccharide assembly outer membrane protein LptD (OstA)